MSSCQKEAWRIISSEVCMTLRATRIKVAIEAAKGLWFLHEAEQVIQGDLRLPIICLVQYRQWILSPNSTELRAAGEVGPPSATKSIPFILPITTRPKERMLDVLDEGLQSYDLSMEHRRGLAKYAAETAWDIIVHSMSPSYNQLNLYIDFTVLHKHVLFHENHNHAMEDSTESASTGAGPASEAAIESLEEGKVFDSLNASCPICLEVLQVGACMPCSHLFHGDCIKTWLRINPCCPVCRFQMPLADS